MRYTTLQTLLAGMLLLMHVAQSAAQPAPAPLSDIPDAKLDEARQLLDATDLGTHTVSAANAAIAVWRPGSAEPVRAIMVRRGVSQDPAFTVQVARGGGVGTVYAVTDPPGYEVLALRMNVRDHTGRPWVKPVTTITATDAIATDLRVMQGIDYLGYDVIDMARMFLDMRDVRSTIRGRTQEPVGSLVSRRTLMAIVIVERVASEIAGGVDPETAIRRTLTALAVNREDAFDYAKSPVGACGAFQFMPRTYRSTRLKFRQARLDANFIRGMRDHVNAGMAQACLADSILAAFTPKQLAHFLEAGDEELGAFIAATYNGGPKYSYRALQRFPGSWDQYHGRTRRHGTKRPETRGLLKPTVHYVAVFRTVYRYLQRHTPP